MNKLTPLGVEESLDKLENRIIDLSQAINSIDKTLIKNTDLLDEHIRRTELAEESIELLRSEMRPVQNHVQFVKNVMAFLVAVGVLEYFKP
jgi:hypothetical protein